MKHNLYVGLDLSLTNTGLSVITRTGTLYMIESINAKERRGEERLDYITTEMRNCFDCFRNLNSMLIYIEGYAMGAKGRVFDIGELGGVVKLILYRHNCNYKVIPPTVLKKFVIGRGAGEGTKKEDMKLFAYKKWGMEFDNNDECDAYCLARLALFEDRGIK
jgi:Holliday junction resolvasome RuvABC endonuclease subunit